MYVCEGWYLHATRQLVVLTVKNLIVVLILAGRIDMQEFTKRDGLAETIVANVSDSDS